MAATGDWVPDVTREAMRRLLAHAERSGCPTLMSALLRAFFMAAAHDLLGVPGRNSRPNGIDLTYSSRSAH
jgi:hypothetical protein